MFAFFTFAFNVGCFYAGIICFYLLFWDLKIDDIKKYTGWRGSFYIEDILHI